MPHILISNVEPNKITLELSPVGARWISEAMRHDNGERSLLLHDVAISLDRAASKAALARQRIYGLDAMSYEIRQQTNSRVFSYTSKDLDKALEIYDRANVNTAASVTFVEVCEANGHTWRNTVDDPRWWYQRPAS